MRIARVHVGETVRYARLADDGAHLYTAAPWAGGEETDEVVEGDLIVDVPVEPTKIVCVGRNYRAHAEELGNEVPTAPLLFLKPPSALLPHDGVILWPEASERVDYEGEIAVVIGRRAHALPEAAVADHVFGLTCANDVTARDLQRADVQFTRGKGFDTFCPCGPWVETETPAWDEITIETRVDGEVRQHSVSERMSFGIAALISYISQIMTLMPGDLVLTGTPAGVAPLEVGQSVEVEVGGVGTLRNAVARA